MKIGVILACFNRREKTIACLDSLLNNKLLSDSTLSVYLLDDASSDGTSAAVQSQFPQVKILKGDGNYFWNGGMRAAFAAAIEDNHDFYLWLNDDVELQGGFLEGMMSTYDQLAPQFGPRQIIIGAVNDPVSGNLTYSGMVSTSKWHPVKYCKQPPDQVEPVECDTMNGNCVLIPAAIVDAIGNMDPVFTHAMGDMEYGFRARENGARLWIAPGYVGTCDINEKHKLWTNPALSLIQRLKNLNSPHGLPFREYAHFVRLRSPLLWPLYVLLPYVKVITGGGKHIG